MTAHLLLITLGPVQDFIAQARRTRDLWHGSHLLSELSRRAARTLVEQGADLIFPAVTPGSIDLDFCPGPLRDGGKPPLNIANKLLVEVPASIDPAALARSVRAEVQRFWRDEIAAPVRAKCGALIAPDSDEVWFEQIGTLLEYSASWVPLSTYIDARHQVEQAVGARKNLREFAPWTHSRPGHVPKSSLDGARQSILLPSRARNHQLAHRLRINDGESLDAISLVKRAGGEPDQFVSIVNIALGSWLRLAARELPAPLDRLKKQCQTLGLARVDRGDLPVGRPFPFDASILLPCRWPSLFEEQGLLPDRDEWGRLHVRPLLAQLSDPTQYVACLVADGDRMGLALDDITSAAGNRAFSRELSGFAEHARKIVEQDHLGSLVYAGGDDVLAFLPLPEALACAEALRQKFNEVMKVACPTNPEGRYPTLSVGLGLGHVMDGMGDLLELGREAERLAKVDRNALAVIVDKRSGGRRRWSAPWDTAPVERLNSDIRLLNDRLSTRKIHQIDATRRRLPRPHGLCADPQWARVLAMEVQRSLERAGESPVKPEEVDLQLDQAHGYKALYDEVSAWIDRMLIAREFAGATPRLRGDSQEVSS